MKKSGIVVVGGGNANENGKPLLAGVAAAPPVGELAAGAADWRDVRDGRCARLAGCTPQYARSGWRRRLRGLRGVWRTAVLPGRTPVGLLAPARAGLRGRHFPFGPWRRAGVTVTVTVVVVIVVAVVDVVLEAAPGAAGSAGESTVVVGVPAAAVVLAEPTPGEVPAPFAVSAPPARAPITSAAQHASVDIQPTRRARCVALCLTRLVLCQRAARLVRRTSLPLSSS